MKLVADEKTYILDTDEDIVYEYESIRDAILTLVNIYQEEECGDSINLFMNTFKIYNETLENVVAIYEGVQNKLDI